VVWIDVDGADNPHEDLRFRLHARGAAFVGRGEGVFVGADGVYFTCTSSGPAGAGQILRYHPSAHEGQTGEADAPGRLQLFVEPTDNKVLDYADNIAVAPWGHIFACEDRYSDIDRNHLKAITPDGKVYTVGCNVHADNAELAGACFAPDGQTLFLNIYYPGITLAIRGPWASFRT
jgi:secreted PhoX family phosphatase